MFRVLGFSFDFVGLHWFNQYRVNDHVNINFSNNRFKNKYNRIMITREDATILKSLLKLRKAGKEEVSTMINFMRKYIDPDTEICSTCPTQVRFAFDRIKSFNTRNTESINEALSKPVKQPIKPDDINKTSKPIVKNCLVCENVVKDQRYNYCSSSCKRKSKSKS